MEAKQLFEQNFLQYASCVIRERAIPALMDGLKPVQRRILQSLFDMDDGKFHKVANVVGHCMQYHPHGESSIYHALVNLANRRLLVDRQGNYGNLFTGDPPSAMRYIECRLLPLARQILHNPELTHYVPSYDGRRQEPLSFPAKLPLALLLGCEGIAVGMATRILPHNFSEVLQAMQAELLGQNYALFPDFPNGGLLDVSDYRDGNGRIRSRATFDQQQKGVLRITGLPYGTTTSSLIKSIESACRRNHLSLVHINDYTAAEVEIELVLPRGADPQKCIEALYAFSDCEVQLPVNLLLIEEGKPILRSVTQVIQQHTAQLRQILAAELELEQQKLTEKFYRLNLEQVFLTKKIYLQISNRRSLKGMTAAVRLGLAPHLSVLPSDAQIERLLEIPIRRISSYDSQLTQKQMLQVRTRLKEVQRALAQLDQYCHQWLQQQIEQQGAEFPRKSQIQIFRRINLQEAAHRSLCLLWDAPQQFLGYRLEQGKPMLTVSEFDRIFVLQQDGLFQIIDVPEKLYLPSALLLCINAYQLEQQTISVLYRDTRSGFPYLKRCCITRYQTNRCYRIVPEHGELLLATSQDGGVLRLSFQRAQGEKTRLDFELSDYPPSGLATLGTCLAKRSCLKAELPF